MNVRLKNSTRLRKILHVGVPMLEKIISAHRCAYDPALNHTGRLTNDGREIFEIDVDKFLKIKGNLDKIEINLADIKIESIIDKTNVNLSKAKKNPWAHRRFSESFKLFNNCMKKGVPYYTNSGKVYLPNKINNFNKDGVK